MLDRSQLLHAVHAVADTLFIDRTHEYEQLKVVWNRIIEDPTFAYKVRACDAPWPVPLWHDPLSAVYSVDQSPQQYTVLAVDGSQIYPDRHQGTSCYLINIGSIVLSYKQSNSTVQVSSTPYVFPDCSVSVPIESPIELVNLQREDLEFATGCQIAHDLQRTGTTGRFLTIFDGSLIFWHLSARAPDNAANTLIAT